MTETAMTCEEKTTIEISTVATTPQSMTEGETTGGTQNDGRTHIKIDDTRNVRGAGNTNATTEGEIFAEKSIKNWPESTVESRIQIRSFRNQSKGGQASCGGQDKTRSGPNLGMVKAWKDRTKRNIDDISVGWRTQWS